MHLQEFLRVLEEGTPTEIAEQGIVIYGQLWVSFSQQEDIPAEELSSLLIHIGKALQKHASVFEMAVVLLRISTLIFDLDPDLSLMVVCSEADQFFILDTLVGILERFLTHPEAKFIHLLNSLTLLLERLVPESWPNQLHLATESFFGTCISLLRWASSNVTKETTADAPFVGSVSSVMTAILETTGARGLGPDTVLSLLEGLGAALGTFRADDSAVAALLDAAQTVLETEPAQCHPQAGALLSGLIPHLTVLADAATAAPTEGPSPVLGQLSSLLLACSRAPFGANLVEAGMTPVIGDLLKRICERFKALALATRQDSNRLEGGTDAGDRVGAVLAQWSRPLDRLLQTLGNLASVEGCFGPALSGPEVQRFLQEMLLDPMLPSNAIGNACFALSSLLLGPFAPGVAVTPASFCKAILPVSLRCLDQPAALSEVLELLDASLERLPSSETLPGALEGLLQAGLFEVIAHILFLHPTRPDCIVGCLGLLGRVFGPDDAVLDVSAPSGTKSAQDEQRGPLAHEVLAHAQPRLVELLVGLLQTIGSGRSGPDDSQQPADPAEDAQRPSAAALETASIEVTRGAVAVLRGFAHLCPEAFEETQAGLCKVVLDGLQYHFETSHWTVCTALCEAASMWASQLDGFLEVMVAEGLRARLASLLALLVRPGGPESLQQEDVPPPRDLLEATEHLADLLTRPQDRGGLPEDEEEKAALERGMLHDLVTTAQRILGAS
ncbi:hypothetical protein PAPYR_1850 [Paratrimastix pyriformis]|uniref:Uncharacterized protein n=1 Tax=Paratrimastix pyriformis TaxID=342808 RepID=A0ABQ8UTQ3_9EUKA|nr:hypothetical protein PAPYR_1850 [Paratrimastix pyriformis]